jgi:hypothetical protein
MFLGRTWVCSGHLFVNMVYVGLGLRVRNLLLSNHPIIQKKKTKLAPMMRFTRSSSSDKSARVRETPLWGLYHTSDDPSAGSYSSFSLTVYVYALLLSSWPFAWKCSRCHWVLTVLWSSHESGGSYNKVACIVAIHTLVANLILVGWQHLDI